MKNAIRNRLNYMFNTFGFKLSFTIMMCLCAANIFLNLTYIKGVEIAFIPNITSLSLLNQTSKMGIYLMLTYIFILLFPFSFSYINECRYNILPAIYSRISKKKIYIANVTCNFIGAFLIFFIPIMLESIVYTLFWGGSSSSHHFNSVVTYTGENIFVPYYGYSGFFSKLSFFHPNLYTFLIVMLFSLFCGLLATCIYTVSQFRIFRKLGVLLFVPIYIITFIQNKFDIVLMNEMDNGKPYFNVKMYDYLTFGGFYGKTLWYFIPLLLMFLFITIILTFREIKKDNL